MIINVCILESKNQAFDEVENYCADDLIKQNDTNIKLIYILLIIIAILAILFIAIMLVYSRRRLYR